MTKSKFRIPKRSAAVCEYLFSVVAGIPEGCEKLAGGRSEAETTGLIGKSVCTLAGVPEWYLLAKSATPSGSNPPVDAFRGWRPSALPPATIWQPFGLLRSEDSVLTLNTYHFSKCAPPGNGKASFIQPLEVDCACLARFLCNYEGKKYGGKPQITRHLFLMVVNRHFG